MINQIEGAKVKQIPNRPQILSSDNPPNLRIMRPGVKFYNKLMDVYLAITIANEVYLFNQKSYENFETVAKKLIGTTWSAAVAEALRAFYHILELNQNILAKFDSSSNVNSVAEFLYKTRKDLFNAWRETIIEKTIKKLVV